VELVKTKVEIEEDHSCCIITLDDDMNEAETKELLDYLKDDKFKAIDKYAVVFPDKFDLQEYFRINFNKFLKKSGEVKPDLNVCFVTDLMHVIGYEQFAQYLTGLVGKQHIFSTLDEARAWMDKK
ncbi:MAG: hypothetical protein ACFFCS_26680, partial [Candidatus Hodarchaeota archaeon]